MGESKPGQPWAVNQSLLIPLLPRSKSSLCQSLFWKDLKSTEKRLTVYAGRLSETGSLPNSWDTFEWTQVSLQIAELQKSTNQNYICFYWKTASSADM